MRTKVYYADTDAGGVVYYGNYMRWLEMARADWLERWGVSLADYVEQGVLFAVRRVEIDYLTSAVLGDEVEVTVETGQAVVVLGHELDEDLVGCLQVCEGLADLCVDAVSREDGVVEVDAVQCAVGEKARAVATGAADDRVKYVLLRVVPAVLGADDDGGVLEDGLAVRFEVVAIVERVKKRPDVGERKVLVELSILRLVTVEVRVVL